MPPTAVFFGAFGDRTVSAAWVGAWRGGGYGAHRCRVFPPRTGCRKTAGRRSGALLDSAVNSRSDHGGSGPHRTRPSGGSESPLAVGGLWHDRARDPDR